MSLPLTPHPYPVSDNSLKLRHSFLETRLNTVEICERLSLEDHLIQSTPEVSPPKWHLGHTTGVFEEFLLKKYVKGYQPLGGTGNLSFSFILNSYYKMVGAHIEHFKRHLISRPSLAEVHSYRNNVNDSIIKYLDNEWVQNTEAKKQNEVAKILELGIQHEKQHQELLLSDIKYNFYSMPWQPTYLPKNIRGHEKSSPSLLSRQFWSIEGGMYYVGHDENNASFTYDNETPRHKILCRDYAIAQQPLSCSAYKEFIEDGGYSDVRLWLSDGWDWLAESKSQAPLYWKHQDNHWEIFTLHGWQELDPTAPVSHLNYYEAQAYAMWVGKRLPTEFEWEIAAQKTINLGHVDNYPDNYPDKDNSYLQPPTITANAKTAMQSLGHVWEWTQSAYLPYPGFRTPAGAIGEYNAKFMVNQMVLRGGSCLSPHNHIRSSYRNYLPVAKRWLCTGLRLACDI